MCFKRRFMDVLKKAGIMGRLLQERKESRRAFRRDREEGFLLERATWLMGLVGERPGKRFFAGERPD